MGDDVVMSDASGTSVPNVMDWDPIKQKLLDADVDIALEAANELRARMEIVHTTEFPRMLSAMLPAFGTVLSHLVRPSPDMTSTEHRVRNGVLEVLTRLPNNEVLRPHAAQILTIAMEVLVNDYEDNALLASRIIFDLHKNYRQMPQEQVQPYLDFVLGAYRSMPNSIQSNFRFPTDPSFLKSHVPVSSPETAAVNVDKDMPEAVVRQIPPASTLSPSGGLPSTPKPRLAPRSSASFRVLTECPLTVMLLFQLHPKFLKSNIQPLISVMMEALGLRAPPLKSSDNVTTAVKRLYHSRSRELVATQVKTLSFLTQFLKGFAELMKPYEDIIATNVVSLMAICPPESISTRRELLHATRHVLATDFRKGFFRHIDALLDERVLMGTHPNSSDQAVLRPLGYSTLADLVHHARSLLSLKQLSRVVYMFSRVVHDSSLRLPLTIQTTAVRLMLNLVDTIFHNKDPNPQLGRDLLTRILDSLVRKLGVLKDYIPVVEKAEQARRSETTELDAAIIWSKTMVDGSNSVSDLTEDSTKSSKDDVSSTDKITRKLWSQDGQFDVTDSLQDVQLMVRSIVVGLKTVIWCINNYRHQREKDKGREQVPLTPGSNDQVASAMHKLTTWEKGLIDKYISYALPCFRVFKQVSTGGNDDKHSNPDSVFVASQYRDTLTYFAAAFTVMDSFNIRRTIGTKIELLLDAIDQDHHVMLIARQLLTSNQKTSFVFASILLAYVVQHIEELSIDDRDDFVFLDSNVGGDLHDTSMSRETVEELFEKRKGTEEARTKRAATILELFERVLKSLATNPDNEAALRPHLRKIVSTCLRATVERSEGWPDNNCVLLKYTFRAISAGKFEESYKELLPLLPTILNGLYRIFLTTEDTNLRHVIIELCLTVPARLSSLLPHMSLLLRMIIQALNSNTGDLVNLGLRTLEFWVDNLNPEFLYPILSKQTEYLSELMTALSSHLRPAPYPYGLLTLRLLGKMGGKNRCFLREPLDVAHLKRDSDLLSVRCEWNLGDNDTEGDDPAGSEKTANDIAGADGDGDTLNISLPLERAVEILQLIAQSSDSDKHSEKQNDNPVENGSSAEIKLKWQDFRKLRSIEPDRLDVKGYCADVVAETKRVQADAALRVIRSALAAVIDLDEETSGAGNISVLDSTVVANEAVKGSPSGRGDRQDRVSTGRSWRTEGLRTASLKKICMGLMFACAIDPVEEEAASLFKGLTAHIFSLVVSLGEHISRIDSYGCQIPSDVAEEVTAKRVEAESIDTKEGTDNGSYPLGCFLVSGPFVGKANPLVLNEAISEVLAESSERVQCVALSAIRYFLDMLRGSSKGPGKSGVSDSVDDCGVFFESLISSLFQACLSTHWNSRSGLHDGILLLMGGLGQEWCDRFEVEAMHVALLGMKAAPRDIPASAVQAFQFFARVCNKLYNSPTLPDTTTDSFIRDPLTEFTSKHDDGDATKYRATLPSPCEEVRNMLVGELASLKQIVRFAARYAIKLYLVDSMPAKGLEELLSSHMATIKKLLFSRSLRLLPLPEQVGVFDALAFIVHQAPALVPLADQHLLAFTSEFLKMASIGDGEMKDSHMSGYVVDKNGFVASVQDQQAPQRTAAERRDHTCDLFLRRECAAKSPIEGTYVLIPEELPSGVQLRVSGLRLFRAVIRQHVDEFFDADPSTPVGNIRPHVISLLFRSLISRPSTAVIAAHQALRDVLALSTSSSGEDEDAKPQSRLPKELLQTCIRPVLLNLREYTRLTVPLLEGLARLLSLLSSWFNTTLGEKLLEHLQIWIDPERVISQKMWAQGEEPLVAAAILDLFALLPQASHFVERLVKTTIKLELSLPAYKPWQVVSPYRRPLARYLSKHPQHAVGFFFQRLKTPVYSELFQDIVSFNESAALRDYLAGVQCSSQLLNICFERPLGIIRSDQSASSKTASRKSEILALHGISTGFSTSAKDSREILRADIETKEKKVQAVQKEVSRAKEQLEEGLASKVISAESQKALEELKHHKKASQAALDKAIKDLNESKQRYASEIGQPSSDQPTSDKNKVATRPMTTEALELQRQGFDLIATLVAKDGNYISNHNDVVKAFRWLWRSKGRSLRLQHEEHIPPRYHDESTMLATFLVNTASAYPRDVDILYELLRIFLQPTTADFRFVRSFLADAVAHKLTTVQKRNLMKRLMTLLAEDGKEETKALSIQHIGIPILLSSSPPDTGVAAVEDVAETSTQATDRSKEDGSEEVRTVLDQEIANKFATEVLFKDGSPIACGDQLRTELLRFSTLLLERADELLAPHRKEVIKFSWSLLRSDDSNCKNWASLNLCRFIAVFETPPRNVLQVYVALLRSFQQEGKDLVQLALSILVPVLPERLPPKEFQKMIESTIKIMYEEGNSPLQLAHVLYTVVINISVFHDHRQRFVRHMINSLNRLGLPPTCPIENRFLAVAIVELILMWGGQEKCTPQPSSRGNVVPLVGTKRKVVSNDYQDASSAENKKKVRKIETGGCEADSEGFGIEMAALLDDHMVESVANFLVRLRILLADSKVEGNSRHLENETTRLFDAVTSRWGELAIRPIYFDKVVSMCLNETASGKWTGYGGDTRTKEKGKGRGTVKGGKGLQVDSSTSSGAKLSDDTKPISSSLLSACLDIFLTMAKNLPASAFLRDNSEKVTAILGPCFARVARHEAETKMRKQLREFLLVVLSGREEPVLDEAAVLRVQTLVESLVLEAMASDSIQQSVPSAGKGLRDRPASKDDKGPGASCIAHFSVDLIEKVSESRPGIVDTFSSSLLNLVDMLCSRHIQDASSQRQGSLHQKQGVHKSFRQKYPTPTSGILESACSKTSIPDVTGGAARATPNAAEVGWARQIPTIGTAVRSLTKSLRLLGSSSVPFTFNESRATLLRILSNILDSSDNVQVLMTAFSVVGDWLLAGSQLGPLTSRERLTFLEKIAEFDLHGLSDIALQPIADLVSDIVIRMFRQLPNLVFGKDEDLPLSRALLACSINANPQIRSSIFDIYCIENERGSKSFQDYTPLQLLWQLFNSDFNGLGSRVWTTVFVEVLLAGCEVRSAEADFEHDKDVWLPHPSAECISKSDVPGLADEAAALGKSVNSADRVRLSAVASLAHGDFSLCQNLLESLLPAAWRNLPSDKARLALVPALESLLSQPYYSQFVRVPREICLRGFISERLIRGINAIRSVMSAILLFTPQPTLDGTILEVAAEKYNCWHEVMTLLERQYRVLSDNSLGRRGQRLQKASLGAIRRGYCQLEESKIGLALATKASVLPETAYAASLDTYDMVKDALNAYGALMDLADTTDEARAAEPMAFEMEFWEERWIALQGELCQLPVVYDYASSTGDPCLMLECAWKSQDWNQVRVLCSSSALLPAMEDGDPSVKMGEILLAINEGKLSNVESLHVQTAQLCLQKWQLLPCLSTGSLAHASILHTFHRLVELRESGQIMVETSNHSKRRTLPDLKNLLSAWRYRLPNDFESLVKWDDIFLWRAHMFSAITSNFHWSEAGTLATLHDRPWTAIRMAKTARKQRLRDVSLMSLNKITDSTMDVSDAFAKLREQILCYDNPDSDRERTGGLNLVNTTNLSFFQASQKSELFRLKAHFLESLGGRTKANRSYCHAVQICPSYSRAWASWGGLCAALGKLAERQHEIQMSKSENPESKEKEPGTSLATKAAQYLAQAMGAFFEAINCDPSEKSRVHLPKCLWMLAKDGSSPGILCSTLETRGVPIPSWVWIPWIPQLLTSLYRTEGRAVKSLLSRVGKVYPQALYYSLRAFYLERRDVERSRGSAPPASGNQQNSVAFAEELMSLLRRSHTALWSSLESVLEELIVKFKPSLEEELLVYVRGILERAESHSDRNSLKQSDGNDDDAVIATITKNLSRISTKFFRTATPDSMGKRDERSRRSAKFRRKYKDMFDADFRISDKGKDGDSSTNEAETLNLSDYLQLLQKWRHMLEEQVSSTPATIPLIESSPTLALFASEAPDLWAGSCDSRHQDGALTGRGRKPDPDVNQSTSSSFVAATTAASVAAQVVAKTALTEGIGGDFGGGSAAIEIPGQYFPNQTNSQNSKPTPELHAKLMRFESRVLVVRRNQQLVRMIGMVGSDGKTYTFSLQWALPYWTRTEERTAQIFSLVDRVLRKGMTSSRNYLSVQPTAVVPIAQRLRITAEDSSRVALDEVFRRWCEKRGFDAKAPSKCFHEEIQKGLEDAKNSEQEADVEAAAQAEENARLRALKTVSETCVEKDMLLEFMHEHFDGPEQLFHFRRNYAGQLATDALIQYTCCVVERNPSRTAFLHRNGRVLTPDYRFEYNNHGFLEPRQIPFRMTPNIQALIGELLLEGHFVPSMGIVASSLDKAQDDLDAALRLLLRDDIVAWYTSKSMAKSDSKMQELEKQLIDRVIRNALHVEAKIADCAPQVPKREDGKETEALGKQPVDSKVKELVRQSTDPRRLCMMPSNYQAWL